MKSKTAQNIYLFKLANKIVQATVEDTEEMLEHAEKLVKDFVPSKYQKSALNRLASKLNKEGLDVRFDTKLTKDIVEKTASVEADPAEILEFIEAVKEAVIAEFNDTLKDVDEVADMEVEKSECKQEIEARLKHIIERKLQSESINFRMSRKYTKEASAEKKTLLQKAIESLK